MAESSCTFIKLIFVLLLGLQYQTRASQCSDDECTAIKKATIKDTKFYKNMIAHGAKEALIEKLCAAKIDNMKIVKEIETSEDVVEIVKLCGLNFQEKLNLKAVIKELSDKQSIADPEELNAIDTMSKKLNAIGTSLDLIAETTKNIDDESNAHSKKIKETFDRTRKSLIQRENELIRKVHRIADEKKLKLTQIANELQTQSITVKQKIETSQKMIKEQIDVSTASKNIKSRKRKILKMSQEVSNMETVDKDDSIIRNSRISVYCNEKEILEFVSNFGDVSSSSLPSSNGMSVGLHESVLIKGERSRRLMMEKILPQTLKNKKFELLLRGSVHGLNTKAFNDRCKDKGSILVIVQSKEYERIFGGYTKIGFNSGINDYQRDDDAFLFYMWRDKARRFPVNSRKAIYSYDGFGVCFGHWDLYWDNDGKGFCHRKNYDYSSTTDNTPISGGADGWTLKNYEVWRVI